MPSTTGFNHLALHTQDLDRFVAFYVEVFDAELLEQQSEGGMRHAMVDLGGGSCLHAFEMPGNPHQAGSPAGFARGHLDHFALNVPDDETFQRLRRALHARGASNGVITDFGTVQLVNFTDPDGCDVEVALWCDAPARTFDERGQIPLELSDA